jgi:osmotically-inducible protein OsmY
MTTTTFYRPCAVLAKAALLGDARHRFHGIVVENDHGTVVLSGVVERVQFARDAGDLAANAAGALVLNRIVVAK